MFKKNQMKLDCMQMFSTKFYMQTKTKKPKIKMFSANVASMDRNLNVKPNINFKTIISEQYWDYLNVFEENEINQLPPTNSKKKKKPRNQPIGKENQRFSGARYTICQKTNFWY